MEEAAEYKLDTSPFDAIFGEDLFAFRVHIRAAAGPLAPRKGA